MLTRFYFIYLLQTLEEDLLPCEDRVDRHLFVQEMNGSKTAEEEVAKLSP